MAEHIRRRGRPKGFAAPQSPVTSQALTKALDLLAFISERPGLTLTEISEGLGASIATVHRLLATLEDRSFVEIEPAQQTWSIGAEAFRLGAAFLRRTNVVERSRPLMRDLMQATGETSNLGVLSTGQVLFLSQVETHESIRAFFPPGTLSPLHASGIGKALLSCQDSNGVEAMLQKKPLQRFTKNTITTKHALLDELKRIRDQGFSFDDEERTVGMRCVAAPILNAYGEAIAGGLGVWAEPQAAG
ncbi:IclR family transcriptional regulator [Ochrobactrum vermis]|uniref:IclR family transcriptional regulator n=1 Tax=Ochrobactrum vermis TaxID=1827297 RepID=A0ABU8PN41_9HYPH